jgi:hypothetical protein
MNPQQAMDTQATLRATFARFMDGSPSERVASELTEMGVPKEAAQDIAARAVVISRDPRISPHASSTGGLISPAPSSSTGTGSVMALRNREGVC